MSAEYPSVPQIQKRLRRKRAILDSWPFFVWLGIAALAYWAFQQGGTFARLNAMVAVPTYVVKAPETGTIQSLAPGLQLGSDLEAGDLIAQMDTKIVEKEIEAKRDSAKWDALDLRRQIWGDMSKLLEQTRVAMGDQKEAMIAKSGLEKELVSLRQSQAKGTITRDQVAAKESELAMWEGRLRRAEDIIDAAKKARDEMEEQRDKMIKEAETRAVDDTSAEIQLLNTRKAALTLKSPVHGQVTKVYARPGELLKQGDPVADLSESDKTRVMASVPEEESTQIATGQTVYVSLPNDRKHYMPAKVTKVSPILTQTVDQASPVQGRMVRGRLVEIEAPANVAHLVPGTWVIVSLKEPTHIPFLSFFSQ